MSLLRRNRQLNSHINQQLRDAGYDPSDMAVRIARRRARDIVLNADEDSEDGLTEDELEARLKSEFPTQYNAACGLVATGERQSDVSYGSIGWIVVVLQIARLVLNWLHDAGILKDGDATE